jgi:hypothetical protein
MIEFNPPIPTRETEELIEIAHSSIEIWQQTAIDQAKEELVNRGVSKEFIQSTLGNWREEARLEEIAYKRQLEENAIESYSVLKMCYILLVAPLILTGKWGVDLSLSELKEANFKRKFRQRLLLLIGGLIFWFLIIVFEIKTEG